MKSTEQQTDRPTQAIAHLKQPSVAAFTLALCVFAIGVVLPLQAQTEPAEEQAPAVTHNTWSSGAPMPTARFGAFAGAIGNNIYVIGGATNSGYQATDVNEIYDAKTNKWSTGASDLLWLERAATADNSLFLKDLAGIIRSASRVKIRLNELTD